ncbi:hypothetical protein C8A05DRAFT_47209 [Staphylotrichum tortipilum]|uniref:chitinase n=1 Tax=Staphylotrichum tortipilum TaxID=2831512 RepID=A0AAN6MDJ2_9PEZI|nr:hypothetical protein C8A05DRAFT_47209 [Staphylotrichum longicolle]
MLAVLGIAGVFVPHSITVSAHAPLIRAASPSLRGREPCPARCMTAGSDPITWPVYRTLDDLASCPETLFLGFSLSDRVDDRDAFHRIFSCTSGGSDWANSLNVTASGSSPAPSVIQVNSTYELGWWSDGIRPVAADVPGLQNEGTASVALTALENAILSVERPHLWVASTDGTFSSVQDTLQSWAHAECLTFRESKNITGPAYLTTPDIRSATNSTAGKTNFTVAARSPRSRATTLLSRADCRTIQVAYGDTCGTLATKCGITGAAFTQCNPSSTLCSTLQPLQHVCCSSGTMPDFRPKPNADGSCASYLVQPNDNCAQIAAANALTVDQLTGFNKGKTWGWNGCTNLWVGTNLCLSSGTPPMPAPVTGAVCGPQKLGTTAPAAGANIATLNPCPLNACCDVWGQCGTTTEFSTDTNTGSPGTAAPGTAGCISNCGTDIVKSSAPAVFRNIGYFEGFGLGRSCLFQDASQIDTSQFTHLRYAFASLTADYQVQVGDIFSQYEFDRFRRIAGPKKILSIGGWTFSTDASTYLILRNGVKPANRLTMATNIANFVKANGLDGVDIDWEYPGEIDINKPQNAASEPVDGLNYAYFLVILKNLLPGKSVSIAAPASFWYLKAFPIGLMSTFLDYIVYMTYDLHGQWDTTNQWSQPGCPGGDCLRSHVNLTETINALSMITKAGVPSNKVVVGVSSYGRSFGMTNGGCHTEECFFTGTPVSSTASPGIREIIADSSRIRRNYIDAASHSNILVYNNNQWVGWMDSSTKAVRKILYKQLSMGGASDWATDLDAYHDPPMDGVTWPGAKLSIQLGIDPLETITCDTPGVDDRENLTAAERWSLMHGNDAWIDIIAAGTQTCQAMKHAGVGATEWEIWNSMVIIHNMYKQFVEALKDVQLLDIVPSLDNFKNTFAPVPEKDDLWIQIALNLAGIRFAMVGGPFFSGCTAAIGWGKGLSGLSWFVKNKVVSDTAKDVGYALAASGTSVAKDFVAEAKKTGSKWSLAQQDAATAYLGHTIKTWVNVTEHSLAYLFGGSDQAINLLASIIKDGKMIEGKTGDGTSGSTPGKAPLQVVNDLRDIISKAFFSYAIPTIWTASQQFPFVVDSGYPCSAGNPLGDYLSGDTMTATRTCIGGKLWPPLTARPPRLDVLDGSEWGGVTGTQIVTATVNTYLANGGKNGAPLADPSNPDTFNSIYDEKTGATAAGIIRLPVCTPEIAWRTWVNECGDSTPNNRGSDASPPVSDCKVLVSRIEATGGNWQVDWSLRKQHQLVEYGKCAFGVTGIGGNSDNAWYYIGEEDISNLIRDSIAKFGGTGKVGTMGTMWCRGSGSHTQEVEWGLYTNP